MMVTIKSDFKSKTHVFRESKIGTETTVITANTNIVLTIQKYDLKKFK